MNSEEDWNILSIAPEGLRTNGTAVVRFKRGAFASLLPVTPAVLKYDYARVNPTTDPCGFSIAFLIISDFIPTTVTLNSYQPFIPNEFLFTEYAKTIPGGEKMEKWEVYAHAVRDIIAKEGNFIKSTKTGRDNVNYKLFMKGIKNEVTIDGKTFKWPHFESKNSDRGKQE